MPGKLAKLADLKAALGLSGAGEDALLTSLLEQATSLAESGSLAGRSLVREASRVEFPHRFHPCQRFIRLDLAPIEAVASVVQLYAVGTDADFAAAIAAGDTLAENVDFVVDAELGKLERINSVWYASRRWLRVEYTGGYIDPDEADPPATSALPPDVLQKGIVQQAVRWWNTQGKDGLKQAGGGKLGASIALHEPNPHPLLVEAAGSLRRYGV